MAGRLLMRTYGGTGAVRAPRRQTMPCGAPETLTGAVREDVDGRIGGAPVCRGPASAGFWVCCEPCSLRLRSETRRDGGAREGALPDCDAMTSWVLMSYVLVSPYVHTHTRVRMFDVDVHLERLRCAAVRGVLCLEGYGGVMFEGRVRKKAKAR